MFPPDLTLMCSFVTCLPLPPRVIPGHLWTLQNPVEPGRNITWLDRKSNEAWNQYVQSRLTWGMLGNGVSGVLWCCFNHRDLGSSTHKQAGYCQNNATPWVAVHVYLWLVFHCLSCAFIFLHLHESVECICAFPCEFSANETLILQSSVLLAFTTWAEPMADPACEARALPASTLRPPPSPPQSPTAICMLMLPQPQI